MRKHSHEILICCLGTEMKWFARLWWTKAELCEFVISLGYIVRPCIQEKRKKKGRKEEK